jgi:hypothetical protein
VTVIVSGSNKSNCQSNSRLRSLTRDNIYSGAIRFYLNVRGKYFYKIFALLIKISIISYTPIALFSALLLFTIRGTRNPVPTIIS